MEKIGKILVKNKHYKYNDNNVNRKINNNDSNVNYSSNSKYSLDKVKFIPNTPETQKAEEIATFLKDTNNYAGFLKVVNTIGCSEADRLLRVVKADINEKLNTSTPVRNPAAYFMWKYMNKFY